ncbi:MAG TPA: zinc-dependent alcohol dehydrogenase family protein [Coleofasciculaceae cyanobacterium]|jgi:NADPH:quinone reductase-like Zn-dependent oxidoreductase
MDKIVRFHKTGDASVLQLENVPPKKPSFGEVRIKVSAFALNRAEVYFRENQYIHPPSLPSRIGYDAAGVIDAVGEGVTNVKVGDRVATYPAFNQGDYGVYGEWAIVPAHAVMKYPTHLAPEEAATIGVQYMTGYFALFEHGKLKKGDRILITAASSSTGVAAINLAKSIGATVIATTRTSAKKQQLIELGADYVIVTQSEDLVKTVLDITKGAGVEVIYDPIAGKTIETYAEIIVPTGVIVIYGVLDTTPVTFPIFPLLIKGVQIYPYKVFDFTGLPIVNLQVQPEAVERAKTFIIEKLKDGSLKTVIAKKFPLEQVADAHRFMESNQQVGKIVVTT